MSSLLFRHAARGIRDLPSRSRLPTAAWFSQSPALKASFDWQDPLLAKNLLTEEEIAIADSAERYCQDKLAPRIIRAYPPTPRTISIFDPPPYVIMNRC